jgi:terminase large subunit-like protein
MSPERDLVLALDPVRLAQAAGIMPDPWQADLLRSSERQLLMLCSRQSGKSTVASVQVAHAALSEPGALCLLVAPAERQAGELFRKVKAVLRSLGATVPPLKQESALGLEFVTGSRILVLPGSNEATIRGFSAVRLLVIDEAARVTDELYEACRPMLATSGGRLVLLSTPFDTTGFFYQAATSLSPDWCRVTVLANKCPRIPRAWLRAERERIGHRLFAREYLCEFTAADSAVFDPTEIEAMLDDFPCIHPPAFHDEEPDGDVWAA